MLKAYWSSVEEKGVKKPTTKQGESKSPSPTPRASRAASSKAKEEEPEDAQKSKRRRLQKQKLEAGDTAEDSIEEDSIKGIEEVDKDEYGQLWFLVSWQVKYAISIGRN